MDATRKTGTTESSRPSDLDALLGLGLITWDAAPCTRTLLPCQCGHVRIRDATYHWLSAATGAIVVFPCQNWQLPWIQTLSMAVLEQDGVQRVAGVISVVSTV